MVLLLMFMVYAISGYQFVCPDKSHRHFRETAVCPNTPSQYTCLYDQNKKAYDESCVFEPDWVPPGQKYIITGALNNKYCLPHRYQPIKFWSNVDSDCIFLKSECNDLGQVISSKRSLKEDITCGCNSTNGFVFITTPISPSQCTPSTEDCSCYSKLCQENAILLSDSTCSQKGQNDNFATGLEVWVHTWTEKISIVSLRRNISDFNEVYIRAYSPKAVVWFITGTVAYEIVCILFVVLVDYEDKVINTIKTSSDSIPKKSVENTDYGIPDEEKTVTIKPKDNIYASKGDECIVKKLVEACKKGSIHDVKSYINQGVSVNSACNNNFTPIYYATCYNKIDICRLLINAHADINQKPINEDTPLIVAITMETVEIIKLYIYHGADVNICSTNNETPLLVSCLYVHDETVIDLLYARNPTNIYKQSHEGLIPLTAACRMGNTSAVKALIAKNVDIDTVDGNGLSPILIACKYGQSSIVNLLVAKGCNMSKPDSCGVTPFMAACEGGHTDIVKTLVGLSYVDINTANKDGVRPIDIACRKNHIEVCKILMSNGIDINMAGKDGWTPLMEACSQGHISTAEYLITNGAKINTKNNAKENALYWSCSGCNIKLFQLLCDKGGEVDIQNDKEQTPLHIASRMGMYTICERLISNKLDINKKDTQGRTPLIEACCYDQVHIFELLKNKNATMDIDSIIYISCTHGSSKVLRFLLTNCTDWNINKRNENKDSPLDLASRFGHLEVCKLLIKHGANKEEENPETKQTPLMEARNKSHHNIVEFLRSEMSTTTIQILETKRRKNALELFK